MLWFAGLGISGTDGMGLDVVKILKQADIVYLEIFTSPITKPELAKIKKLVKGKFKTAPRWLVEDGKAILEDAKRKEVVLLSYGDPYIATTHIELRTRAISEKIKTGTIHAASAITSLVGECGLHYYKIGKIVTMMQEQQSASSVYYTTYDNLVAGNHTIIVLEYNQDAKFFLNPKDALNNLLLTESGQKRNVVDESSFAIVASRIGSKTQKIVAGKFSSLKKTDFGKPPHSIIIPGRMHFTESDALKVLARCLDEPFDNSSRIKKISDQMLEKYIPKARKALEDVTNRFKDDKGIMSVLENAELYLDDAEKFQSQGNEELAVLSIGYAEGLIDALRFSKGIDPWAQSL
ncbi:MAG TPA: diphthine synthase [Nitrosopumilaceae archaeon]|nr:diphthine synthase [Nitrosopumilaceae archaeon]